MRHRRWGMVRTAADAAADAMRAAVFGEAGVEERVLEEAAHQDSVFRDAVHSATPRSSARPGGEAGGSTPWPDLSTTARGGSPELGDFIEAAGLLEYDPAAITRIYAGHPQRLLRRLAQTLIPIGLYLLGVGTDWLLGMLANPERSRARARECANLLVDLGPAFIKAGQALSTRPDIVPPMLLEELAQLQDQLPGFDSALAMA